jgi:hypothetical protein
VPIYTLECDYCCLRSEHILGMNDSLDDRVECPMCGGEMCRRDNRIYDVPLIQGDTVAGGCSYAGYDEGLGEYVMSKSHRKELMDKKGLTEYNPDPTMKKHRDEARYIRSHAKRGDTGAVAAIQKEYKTALDTRRNRLIRKSLDESLKKVDAE